MYPQPQQQAASLLLLRLQRACILPFKILESTTRTSSAWQQLVLLRGWLEVLHVHTNIIDTSDSLYKKIMHCLQWEKSYMGKFTRVSCSTWGRPLPHWNHYSNSYKTAALYCLFTMSYVCKSNHNHPKENSNYLLHNNDTAVPKYTSV